nr:hypothetical protein [Tanacetum cinerariifolium]
MHQPWRLFAAFIKRCLSGKPTGLDSLRLSCAQIIWDTQIYGAYLPDELTKQDMLDSKAYKEYYAVASGEEPPKAKKSTRRRQINLSLFPSLSLLQQLKVQDSRLQLSSGDGVEIQSKVPDEQQQKVTGTNEGAGVRPEVPDVPKYNSKSEEESWTFSQDDEDDVEESDMNDDSEETESDNDGDDLTHPNISTYKSDDEEEEKEKNKSRHGRYSCDSNNCASSGIESILNPNIQIHTFFNVPVSVATETPHSNITNPQTPILIIQPLQQTLESTTTTTIPTKTLPDIPKFASLSQFDQQVSALETKFSKFRQTNQFAKAMSSISGIVDNYLSSKMKEAVDVAIQLQINKLEEEVQAENQEFLNQKIIIDKMEEHQSINRSDIQKNLYNTLVESYNYDKDIFSSYGDVVTLKRGRDDQDKDEDPFARSNRRLKRRRSGKEAKSSKEPTPKDSKSTCSSKGESISQPKSLGKFAYAEEHGQKVDDLEEHSHQEFNTGDDDVIPTQETVEDTSKWNPPSSPTPDCEWHKTKIVDKRPSQLWISQLAQATGTQSSFNKFLATPIYFFAFIMNRLKIDNMTQEVLAGPTYDLIKGTCKSVVELEYHLEEVFKATNDRLDWHNPEGCHIPMI